MKKALLSAMLVVAIAAAAACDPQWPGKGNEEVLTLYGNVDIREVQLGFRVSGRLQLMYFEEGDAIESGALLATLDDKPQRESLAVAAARVMEAQANLDRANTGSRPQEIQQAQALVSEAEAALDNADKQLIRQRELYKDGLNSKRALDNAIAAKDQAAARLAANQEALALAVEGFREEDISAAAAAFAAAQAQRDQAQTQLDDTRLLAPSKGVIQVRAREPGAMLAVGSPVYTLSLTETVYVRAYVSETSLGRLAPGATVYVTSDSSERRYEGQVGFISPRAEFTPKTVETPELRSDLVYRLRIVVGNADQALRQGMPVTVEVPREQG